MARNPFLLSFGSALLGVGLATAQAPALPEPAPQEPAQAFAFPDKAQPAAPTPAPALPDDPAPLPPPKIVPPPALAIPAVAPPAAPILTLDNAAPCRQTRLTVEADYLLWWLKAAPTPPVLTSSSNPADLGVIGNPTTTTLFGGRNTSFGPDSGLRLFLDYRLNDAWSVQIGGFFMEQQARGRTASSDANGNPTIAIPFVSSFDGSEQANVLSAPGALAGSASARIDNRLWGMEANASGLAFDRGDLRLNLLGGFRYLNLRENLNLDTNSTLLVTPGVFNGNLVNPGTTFIGSDEFGTSNEFYGGQLGFEGEWHRGAFFVSAFTKLGLGVTHERSKIDGSSVAVQPGGPTLTARGDTLALSSNIGTLTDDRFAVVPEVGINVGVQVNEHFSVHAGYSFLYWSDVVRAGDQIDRQVNINLIPTQNLGFIAGPNVPAASLRHTDFWAQGLNFGMKVGW